MNLFGKLFLVLFGIAIGIGIMFPFMATLPLPCPDRLKEHAVMTRLCDEYFVWSAKVHDKVDGMERHCAPYKK